MNWQQILFSFDKSFYYLFPATAVAMTTAFYVIKTYQSVFERRMRTLQFRSPGIAPGNADESAPVSLYNKGETWNFDLDGIILADFGSTRRFVDLLRWTQ